MPRTSVASGFSRTSVRLKADTTRVLALLLLLISSARVASQGALPDLRGVDELKSWFNAEKGHVRLVLLLSPT